MSRQKIRKLTPRYSIFLAGILFVFVLFFYQLYMIFFVYSDRLPRKSFTQTAKISTRGLIKDRNGILLATNVPSYSVVVNPSVMTKDTYLKILGHLSSSISSLIRFEQAKAKQAKHLIVEKNLSDLQIASLKSDNSLMREGVFIEKEYRRFYPLGEAISPVIGILDAKGHGQLGIENLLDSHLQKDDISLTIDSISQAIAYSELEDAIKNQHA